MSVQEMKARLLEEIQVANDEWTLQEVYDILHHRRRLLEAEEHATVYQLTDMQRASVRKGIEDFSSGRTRTDEEAEADLDKWFDEEEKKWREK